MRLLKRLDWAIILLMDVPFAYAWAAKLNVSWRTKVRFLWTTGRAMWKYGE